MINKLNLEAYQNEISIYQSDMWADFYKKIPGVRIYKFDSFYARETFDSFYIGGITKSQLNNNLQSLINTINILKEFVINSNDQKSLILDFQILENDTIESKLHSKLNDIGIFSYDAYLVPRKRCLIDLSQSLKDIKKNYYNKTLNDINRAIKNGVKIIEKWNADEMYSIYLETSKRQNFKTHSAYFFEKMLETIKEYKNGKLLFSTNSNNDIMGFSLIVEWSNILYYLYTGSKHEFNHFNGASVLQNYIIEYAKEKNYYIYDLMGIRNSNYGPSKFKLKFGTSTIKLIDTFRNTGF